MLTVNIDAAQIQLSQLIDQAAADEEVVITRSGHPVARLVPLASASPVKAKRRLGALAGQFTVPDDFNAPLTPDGLATFEGR